MYRTVLGYKFSFMHRLNLPCVVKIYELQSLQSLWAKCVCLDTQVGMFKPLACIVSLKHLHVQFIRQK